MEHLDPARETGKKIVIKTSTFRLNICIFQKSGPTMGNFVGKAMEDSMQRNQSFMTEINRFGIYLSGSH